jgi:hypothetical protein
LRQVAGLAALLVTALAFVGGEPPAQARGTRLAIPLQELGSAPALLVSRIDSEGVRGTSIVLAAIPSPTNTPPARIVLSVPKGYELQLDRLPTGSTVGFAVVLEADPNQLLSGSTSALTDALLVGTVVTADPKALESDAAAQACAPGPHLAAWLLQLERKNGEQVQIALLIDAAGAGDPPTRPITSSCAHQPSTARAFSSPGSGYLGRSSPSRPRSANTCGTRTSHRR